MLNIHATHKFAGFGGESIPLWRLEVRKGDLVHVNMGESASGKDDNDYVCTVHLVSELSEQRFILDQEFIGQVVSSDEDSFYIRSEVLAMRMIERIKQRGTVNLAHWYEHIDPPKQDGHPDEYYDADELAHKFGI